MLPELIKQMNRRLADLAETECLIQDAKNAMKEMLDEVHQNPEYLALQDTLKQAQEEYAHQRKEIEEDALDHFEATGEKHLGLYITVKEYKQFEYDYDGDELKEWCLKNLIQALNVNMTVMNQATKAGLVDIATTITTPKVTISKSIKELLPKE